MLKKFCFLMGGLIFLSSLANPKVSNAATCTGGTKNCYQKRFRLDLYYAPTFYSNRAITHFGQDVLDGVGTIYDWLGEKTYLSSNALFRFLWGVTWLYYPQFMNYTTGPLNLMMHEYGHASRSAAVGGRPGFGYFGGSSIHSHFLTYFLMGYIEGWQGGYATTTGNSFSPSVNPSYWSSVTTMGGVNNSAYFAETLSDRAYYLGSHALHVYTYMFGKLDAYNYALRTYQGTLGLPAGTLGDMGVVKSYYDGQGMGISYNDIWTGSLNSLLFSSTSYAYILGGARYVLFKDPVVRSLELGPLKLPDLNHYLTSEGLSYKVSSGLRFGQTFFPFSVEMVYKGRTAYEAALAIRQYKDSDRKDPRGFYEWGLVANTLGGIGGHYKKEFKMNSNTLLDFGAIIHHYRTFQGERNTTAMMAGPIGIEAWAALTKTY